MTGTTRQQLQCQAHPVAWEKIQIGLIYMELVNPKTKIYHIKFLVKTNQLHC